MKHNVKRILAALLVLCMVLGVLPTSVLAGDETVGGDPGQTTTPPAINPGQQSYTVTFYDEDEKTPLKTFTDVTTIAVSELPVLEEREGYTARWADNRSESSHIGYLDISGTEITVSANADYYKNYKPNTYIWTATGNTANASGNAAFGMPFTVPAYDGAVETGKVFLAWNGNDGRTYLAGTQYTWAVADDLTLTPMFVDAGKEYYVVKFATGNGLFDVQLVEKSADAKLVLPTGEPTRDGYTFGGWYNGETEAVAGSEITADVTYTAKWTENAYTLTYTRGAEADASEYKCILVLADGKEVELYNNDANVKPTYEVEDLKAGDTVKLGTPALPGYNFVHWISNTGATYNAGQTITMPAADVTLTAVWEEKEDTVIVLFKDGETIVNMVIGVIGKTVSIPANDPTSKGKVFGGWEYDGKIYSNESNQTEVTIPEGLTDGILTLTAQWTEETYTQH